MHVTRLLLVEMELIFFITTIMLKNIIFFIRPSSTLFKNNFFNMNRKNIEN